MEDEAKQVPSSSLVVHPTQDTDLGILPTDEKIVVGEAEMTADQAPDCAAAPQGENICLRYIFISLKSEFLANYSPENTASEAI